ncbi:hypothetical protein [Acinetobacter guerrae]|uniref:hypothetical protein n=1 Tax=Acinetobacter guerrae TaxID=1843371 RepID=UPI00125FBD45|nr:hypothetical protein [Acinetobacter guerrae]
MSSKHTITDKIDLLLIRHNNAEATQEALKDWTNKQSNFMNKLLNDMKYSLKRNDPISFKKAFETLESTIDKQEETLNKIHDMLLFEDDK